MEPADAAAKPGKYVEKKLLPINDVALLRQVDNSDKKLSVAAKTLPSSLICVGGMLKKVRNLVFTGKPCVVVLSYCGTSAMADVRAS
jgi:hypothetical protein